MINSMLKSERSKDRKVDHSHIFLPEGIHIF